MSLTIDNTGYINNEYNRYGVSETSVSTSDAVQSRGENVIAGGTTITGEIVAKDGDQVTINLGGNQTISAKLQGNADIEVGMRLTFEVAKGADNRTALRPLFSNLANNNAAMSALKAAGLPINNTTMLMTDRMMQEGMPVNRNALAEMFRNVSTHNNVSPESIVQMTKLNMPLTDSNVIQFDNYRNFEHQISSDLQNVSDAVTELFKEAVGHSVSGAAEGIQSFGTLSSGDVITQVLDLIDPESLETIAGQQGEDGLPLIPADDSGLVNPNLSLTAAEQETLCADLENILILAGEESNIHEPLDPGQIMAAVKELTSEYPPSDLLVLEAQTQAYSEESSESTDEEKLNEEAARDVAGLKNAADLGIENSDGKSVASDRYVKDDTDIDKNAQKIQEQDKHTEVSGDKTNTASAGGTVNNPGEDIKANTLKYEITQKLSKLLQSDGFSKLLKDSIKSQMSIKPEDVAKNGKIEELYDKIQKTSAKITELMESIGRSDAPAARAAGALSDNVNFMNQLNEFVNYVQLPLKMAGEDANGELYVYTNRKNLSNSDGNFSALLHLDMEHLGPMDIYVTMRDYTKVSTNFYLQSEELLDFIGGHLDELTKRLADKGYDTQTKVTKKDPGTPIAPIADEFTKEEAKVTPVAVAKMRFDVRA